MFSLSSHFSNRHALLFKQREHLHRDKKVGFMQYTGKYVWLFELMTENVAEGFTHHSLWDTSVRNLHLDKSADILAVRSSDSRHQ